MRGAGADDDHVGGFEGAARAVGMDRCHLRPGLERDARAGRQAFVDFDRDDFAGRAGELGEDGGVIAGAAAEMQY